jgi:hypothetical protein
MPVSSRLSGVNVRARKKNREPVLLKIVWLKKRGRSAISG